MKNAKLLKPIWGLWPCVSRFNAFPMIITDLHARLAKLAVTAMKLDRKERELRERATAWHPAH